ncbi:MAG: HEAT repeat domain-containing protein [Desulfoplanes sp.]|nr:HEAT repeat domain-containing protein [Desulfoplanes sp.]MDD4648440.1 HEAT repeat domain-containing protein [Desulfoplanes sp.]
MNNTSCPEDGRALSGRTVKKMVFAVLGAEDWEARLPELDSYPEEKVLGPLFSALCNSDPLIKWHAVTAFGRVVPSLAQRTMERARVLMRRFIWNLNDESGGIGWGAPEAMGEIMANDPQIAKEFHPILIHYIFDRKGKPDNFLEHMPLRRGAYWGIGRLLQNCPEYAPKALPLLIKQLGQEKDPEIIGLVILALRYTKDLNAQSALTPFKNDTRVIQIYRDKKLQDITIGELTRYIP